jgi:uncharacterized surface protein with fasciclin (FAS1) repeats
MLAAGCTDGKDVYNIPDNLDGEIYKQLSQDERFSTFVAAIDKVPGLKEELNTSGLYTVFAPTNDAFTAYFNSNGKYHTLAEIPTDELTRIVKFHVLKWMVFSYQFANPGATKEAFDVFKYVTRSNVKYSEYSETLKKQVSLYYENKYIQVYTPNFFSYYNVSAADYQRVFGANSQVSSPFNVLGASVLQADIASGNGVIHIIDRVLDVPTNIAQELDQNSEYSSYNAVLKRRYVSYAFDLAGTRLQGNYGDPNNDGILDSLFRRTYSIIPGLDYEKGFSLTAYIPTKQAFENYMLNLTNIFGSEAVVPTYTLDLLFKSHFANSMYWPSKVENGLAYNLLQNVVDLKPEDINSVKMLTNGLFYQTKKVVEPDAFKSVSAPAFFSKNYSLLGRLLFVSNYYNALSVKSSKITFFAPTDDAFAKIGISYNTTDPLKPVFTINDAGKVRNMSTTEMENLLGNNAIIGELNPASFTDGFYETLNGSIIQVKDGAYFNDKDSIPVITIPGQAKSNGYVYGVNRFLSIPKPSYTFIINTLQTPEYTEFLKIIQTVYPSFATSGFSFINQSADLKYTILIPSNDAVNNARAEGLIPVLPESSTDPTYAAKKEELLQFVRYHVLKGRSMTDGKVVGNIETAHYVKSSPTSTKEIYVPISVSSANGGLTITDGKGRSASTLPGSDRICKDGVIHLIDKVLTY